MTPTELKTAYSGKRVLITGNRGFKGSWLQAWLTLLGADCWGVDIADVHPLRKGMADLPTEGARQDVCDPMQMAELLQCVAPDYVFHLAAQPIVKTGLERPWQTVGTNVMGTVAVLEAVRVLSRPCRVVVVTSDKVYRPGSPACIESDPLGGNDPYAASKAAAEHIAHAYAHSYGLSIATARGGNVIGGGDFGPYRIVPDCWRAWKEGTALQVRRPDATRPFQHVLDCLHGYLMLGAAGFALAFNFAPFSSSPVRTIVEALQRRWGFKVEWDGQQFPETNCLSILALLAKQRLGWMPKLALEPTIQWTAEWYEAADPKTITVQQIERFMAL